MAQLLTSSLQIAIGRACMLAAWVAVLPLIQFRYGPEILGAWVMAQGWAFWAQLLDLGIGVSAQQHLAGCTDSELAGQIVASAKLLTLTQCALAFLAAIVIWLGPPAEWLLGRAAHQGTHLLALAAFAAGLQVRGQLAFRRLASQGLHGPAALAQGAGALTGFGAALITPNLEASFAWVVFGGPIALNLYGLYRLSKPDCSWQQPTRKPLDKTIFRVVLRTGWWFAVSQLAALTLSQGDVALISAWFGPVAAGEYGSAMRIIGLPLFALGAILSAAWPSLTTAWKSGERDKAKILFLKLVKAVVLLTAACLALALLLIAEPPFLPPCNIHIVAAIAGAVVLGLWAALFAQCLQALGEIRFTSLIAMGQVLIAVPIVLLGAQILGASGVPIGLALATALVPLPALFCHGKRLWS